ncbi:MAG: GNAT family N-acetyltransferase [Candidatus Schekmanbacteria bacterium]|nr:GNAT family N-acetyltransferase [Candidatus Schekmanbacteria bacterium]
MLGLVTWCAPGTRAEIGSLEAFPPGLGVGGRLLEHAEAELASRGIGCIELVTTNDNVRALTFYLRHGYRLVQVILDGMDRVRARKPDTPVVGSEGLPLRDLWLLTKDLRRG